MVFSSGLFLVYFLPIVLTVYLLLPRYLRNSFLLVSSIFFYWWGAPDFVWIVLLTSGINFFIALKIPESQRKKLLLGIYVAINLGLLAYFKYANFFIENLNELLQSIGFRSIQWTSIVLPVGISFFTFQSITYGVDVYRKDAEPQKNILNYWLYILFFPQLIAGPIVTYRSIASQLKTRQHSLDNVLDGFVRFTIGLAKKVLIANVMAEYAELLLTVDDPYTPASSTVAWLIALAYTFEIYFDFSGYSDMAIGLGKIFGFTFPENFDRPYLSRSITEFWRRWHMTLGNFMKNYLYIPLGGNQSGIARTYINLATVFLLSGLWHGASWNFVAWGLFHGIWLILERLVRLPSISALSGLKIAFTFLIVLHGWVLFDAHSLGEAWQHLNAMYSFENFRYLNHKNNFYYEVHLILAALICLAGLIRPLHRIYFLAPSQQQASFAKYTVFGLTSLVFLISMAHVVSGSFNPFIYFQF